MQDLKIALQESLERRILHGLACEWDNACWLIPPADRSRMSRPAFSVHDMQRRLGYWSRDRNEIAVSRSLVLDCPWDDVREVLYHEMAHQYAVQVLNAAGESAHGESFQAACRILRANPRASAAVKTLHQALNGDTADENDKILVRVKKLMSLAESSNRHEAESAMSKAHSLIRKYNIDLLNDGSQRNFGSVFVGTPALRHPREAYHLANLLQAFYFVQGIWVSAYVVPKGKMGRVFEISGTVPNLKIAAYVHDFVMNYIDGQWRRYNASKRLNRRRKTDFSVGIIEGFHNKLRQEKRLKLPAKADRALISVEDPLLTGYMSHRYPATRSFRRAAATQDDRVLKDGYAIGRRLVISKGVSHRSHNGRRIPYFGKD